MTAALLLAGSIAGALIAIGTLARYLLRRAVRAAAWVAALIRLPDTLTELSAAVHGLAAAVDRLQPADTTTPAPRALEPL